MSCSHFVENGDKKELHFHHQYYNISNIDLDVYNDPAMYSYHKLHLWVEMVCMQRLMQKCCLLLSIAIIGFTPFLYCQHTISLSVFEENMGYKRYNGMKIITQTILIIWSCMKMWNYVLIFSPSFNINYHNCATAKYLIHGDILCFTTNWHLIMKSISRCNVNKA